MEAIYYLKKKNYFLKIKNKIFDQWKYIYFELEIQKFKNYVDLKSNDIEFRLAKNSDLSNIKIDIFPQLRGYGENDKKYLLNPDLNTIFIGTYKQKIIHYFIVFKDPLNSPLIKTPLKRKYITENSVYLGSAFTLPEFRGKWITLNSISFILSYLKSSKKFEKVLLLVHKNTKGAIPFFKRLGFVKIENAVPANIFEYIKEKL